MPNNVQCDNRLLPPKPETFQAHRAVQNFQGKLNITMIPIILEYGRTLNPLNAMISISLLPVDCLT